MVGGAKPHPLPGKWYWEPKANGTRALVHVPTGTMFNRHGDRLSISGEFDQALAAVREAWCLFGLTEWLDCETLARRHGIAKGTIVVLDCVDVGLAYDYESRRALLEGFFTVASLNPGEWHEHSVCLLPNYLSPHEKWWQDLQRLNGTADSAHWFWEGMVAKRADSLYQTQLRSSSDQFPGWMKFRWKW